VAKLIEDSLTHGIFSLGSQFTGVIAMKKSLYAAVAATAIMAAGSASAGMVYNIVAAPTPVADNNFFGDYEALFGVGNVGFGLVQSAETTADTVVSFSAELEESGFINGWRFEFTPGPTITFEEPLPDIATGVFIDGPQSFTGDDMQFFSNNGTPAGLGDAGFGIFYDLTGTIDTVFLAYADRDGNVDSDFDDIVVETAGAVNVVPLPAAGWMLLAGLGGLAAMRRRQKS
jgi:hypothetical protein